MTTDEIVEAAIQGHASTRDAIRWAIKQEREQCALICDAEWGTSDEQAAGVMFSKEIRARGEK